MSRVLLAFILSLPCVLNASGLALKRLTEQRLDGAGWNIYPHGSELVALNRDTLRIQTLDATTGDVKSKDSLHSEGMRPRLLETLSSSKGQFLVALVREKRLVELHQLDSNISWEVIPSGTPLTIKLIEGKNGNEIFLVVATSADITVYRRVKASLEKVRTITPEVASQQVQVMRSNSGLIVLSILDTSKQIHAVQLDIGGGPHEHVTLGRPTVKFSNAVVDGRTNDYVTSLISPHEFRFYVEGETNDSDPFPMDAGIFPGQWIKGAMNRSLFASAHSGQNGGVELSINDPYLLSEPVNIGVGPARTISEVGNFTANGKLFYYFVKDHHVLMIHNDSEDASITYKDDERVLSVQVIRPAKALAILIENTTTNTSRFQLISADRPKMPALVLK